MVFGSSQQAPSNKQVDRMVKDLRIIKSKMCPDLEDQRRAIDTKDMDQFQITNYDLDLTLNKLDKSIKRLEAMQKGRSGERGQEEIKLRSENTKMIKKALADWATLRSQYAKDEKKRTKLPESERKNRREDIANKGQLIQILHKRNGRGKEQAAQPATASRRQREAKRRMGSRQQRRAERARAQRNRDGEETEMTRRQGGGEGLTAITVEEQEFADLRDAEFEAQDEILKEIAEGLREMEEIAIQVNKEIQKTGHLVAEATTRMAEVQGQVDQNMVMLKGLLADSGGILLWCPRLVCLVLFLAIAGYVFTIIA